VRQQRREKINQIAEILTEADEEELSIVWQLIVHLKYMYMRWSRAFHAVLPIIIGKKEGQ
jgi:hypothetical protein